MELTLRFGQMECDRCGTPRIICFACPTCGSPADEREADVPRQRRRRLVEAAQAALAESVPVVRRSTPAEVLDDLEVWIDQLNGSAADFEDKPEAVARQQLEAVARGLSQIADQTHVGDKRRPWVASWRALDQVERACRSLFESYLEILVADGPLTAQRGQPALQHSLDSAADSLSDLSAKFDRFRSLSAPSAAGDDLVSLAAVAFHSTNATDLLDLDRKGSELGIRITGGSDLPSGIGLVLSMRAAAVELLFDSDRFVDVATDTYSTLMADPEQVRTICQNENWLADSVTASIEARDAATAAHSVAQAAWNDRLEVRALIMLGHAVAEGAGKFVLASLLSTKTRTPYGRLRHADAGDLIGKALSAGLGPSIRGIDKALRNAHAHSDWAMSTKGVELRPGKPGAQTLAVEDVVDLVLCGVESLLALDTALLLAAAATGADFSRLDWRQALSLNDANAARLMLAMAGWQDVIAEVNASNLTVSGHAPETAFSVAILGALSPCLSPDLTTIRLEVIHPDGRRRVLEGPAALIRGATAGRPEMEKGAAMIELLHHSRLDGEPMASEDHVRRWSTSVIMQALQAPLPEAVHSLRMIRALGERVGDPELVAVANESMELSRRIATGDVAELAETPVLTTIYRWARLPVAPLLI